MKRSLPIWVGALVSASVVFAASSAAAHPADPAPPPEPEVLADGFVSPLKIALERHGSVVVADAFAGTLNRIDDGEVATLYTAAPGTEVSAVSTTRRATVFAERVGTMETVESALLKRLDRDGEVSTLADILAFETAENPDGDQHYGFSDLDAACEAQLPPGVPLDYNGLVDSHPYATLPAHDGSIIVADAGANALLSVDRHGEVSTLAVLPPQRVIVGEWAAELGIPPCAYGHPFDFEPVPTDVEYGPDGELYVTLLPGGPESPASGARGSVVEVDPCSGEVETVASGLVTATDLAVSPDGDIYVAELFGGRISVIPEGSDTPETYRELPTPAAVEWSRHGLYATIDALSEDPEAPPVGKVIFLPF